MLIDRESILFLLLIFIVFICIHCPVHHIFDERWDIQMKKFLGAAPGCENRLSIPPSSSRRVVHFLLYPKAFPLTVSRQ